MSELPEGFEVMEAVDVGDLSQVKESKPLVPPTKNVRVQIKRATPRSNEGKTYRWISLGLQIVDGINAEGKYKGMYVNTDNILYFADAVKYPKLQDKKFLASLASLQRATGTLGSKIDDSFIEAIKDKQVLCDIRQKYDDYRGEDINFACFLKELPLEQQV